MAAKERAVPGAGAAPAPRAGRAGQGAHPQPRPAGAAGRRLGRGRADHRRRRGLRGHRGPADDPPPGRSRRRRRHRVHHGGQRIAELDEPLHRLRVRRPPRRSGAGRRTSCGRRAAWPAARSCTPAPTWTTSAAQIDTTTLAEDTVTTFLTQLGGRTVDLRRQRRLPGRGTGQRRSALWKQRLRWSRGNLQVARRFQRRVLPARRGRHRLGRPWFGLMWWSTLLLPAFMILASAALVVLWLSRRRTGPTCSSTSSGSPTRSASCSPRCSRCSSTVRWPGRSWRQALAFPGLISLTVMAWVLVPRPMHALDPRRVRGRRPGLDARTSGAIWRWPPTSGCRCAWSRPGWSTGWTRRGRLRRLNGLLVFLVGYGPLLCAITFAAYVAEARGAATTWDKTEKTGRIVRPV